MHINNNAPDKRRLQKQVTLHIDSSNQASLFIPLNGIPILEAHQLSFKKKNIL